jgi:hypothetical protein
MIYIKNARWDDLLVPFCAMSEFEQLTLSALVTTLPPNPVIIELGSFIGGSIVLMNKIRPDAHFIVLEDFRCDGNAILPDGSKEFWHHHSLGELTTEEWFHQNTKHMKDKIDLHSVHFWHENKKITDTFINTQCDLYFDDCGADNAMYWSTKVRSGGIVCGHDYKSEEWINDSRQPEIIEQRKRLPGVNPELVDNIAKAYNAQLFVQGCFWWFRKP